MVQPLMASNPYSSPFILAAYGISNKFKAVDVLHRWIWKFEKSRESSVRIVAFATDCDPRYLLAMRLATSFFAKYNNYSMHDHPNALEIDLPKDWRTWFFMSTRQVFFCFQDPMHLCTKIRNRILSNTASMLIGKETVSIEVLMELVQNTSKLAHGLVKTDIDPKDRQNVSSCLKLASDDVSLALEDINNSLATRIYLFLLRCIILAYVEHNTSIVDRIYNSWLAVFICRIWQTWLLIADKKDMIGNYSEYKKDNLFITVPTHFSIELNAHTLLAICLLVRQHELPDSSLLISNYHSQSCESTFRLTRSMSGAFSSVVNFTTDQFLKRAGKLSVLTDLESKSESGQLDCPLQFPKHHKRRRKRLALKKIASSASGDDHLSNANIKNIISRAFDDAYNLLAKLGVNIVLEKKKMNSIGGVSSFVRTQFENKFKKISYDDSQTYSSDEESSEYLKSNVDLSPRSDDHCSSEDDDYIPSLSANGKQQFHGMRIFDNVSPSVSNSYFKVDIDGKKQFIHKQTACWLLADGKANLSADRLKRVQQSSR
ncbi:unnamed protein product [Adineta steineri]|nr:unnamed protein product [Adineta steineri]